MIKKLRDRPLASDIARSLVFIPALVRPIRRPRSPFYPRAGRRAMSLELSLIDHDTLASALWANKPSIIRMMTLILPDRFKRLYRVL